VEAAGLVAICLGRRCALIGGRVEIAELQANRCENIGGVAPGMAAQQDPAVIRDVD
jgi:hypothetical protein